MLRLPLEGVRVVEVAVVFAGPAVCQALGDLGSVDKPQNTIYI